MVKWHNPILLLEDYITFIKLNHVIAGIYIWETVITTGFELDMLRRKRPYKWTIWLYLGTRYTGLLAFVCLLVDLDAHSIPCRFSIANFALPFAAWSFASLLIVLRVIAIWNRNTLVSLIAVGVWSGGLALNIRNLTMVAGTYSPVEETCIVLDTHRGIVNGIGILVVDVVLLLTMLVGLLRFTYRSPTGIWKLLYQQCIIWLVLALVAEAPVVVFLILNLNDAWNEMLIVPAIAILSIGAARMYRSLSDHGSFTEYESSGLPQLTSGTQNPTARHRKAKVHTPIHFASAAQSVGTRTTNGAPVFVPVDQIHLEFVPSGSFPSIVHENTKDKTASDRREIV